MNQDYPLFVHWSQTLDWILDTVERFPKNMRFTLANRIANLALDVMQSIVEAIYSRQRREVLNRINLWLEQLRVLFRLCHQRRLLAVRQYEHIALQLNQAGQMVGGWVKHETSRSSFGTGGSV